MKDFTDSLSPLSSGGFLDGTAAEDRYCPVSDIQQCLFAIIVLILWRIYFHGSQHDYVKSSIPCFFSYRVGVKEKWVPVTRCVQTLDESRDTSGVRCQTQHNKTENSWFSFQNKTALQTIIVQYWRDCNNSTFKRIVLLR